MLLRELALGDEAEFRAMEAEFKRSPEIAVPYLLGLEIPEYADFLRKLDRQKNGVSLPEGFVPSTTLCSFREDGHILGMVNIRHSLTDALRRAGGTIGYGIRPSERRKGYGVAQLRLALEVCRDMGMERVLLTCREQNTASARVIEACGGKLEWQGYVIEEAQYLRRYWIEME